MTSMNLYEYSMVNNHELGIIFSAKEKDFSELFPEIKSIILTDYPDFDFSFFKNKYSDYSMGKLFSELRSKYKFPNASKNLDGSYIYFCDAARDIHKFMDSELYQDKTAVLRSTQLNKNIYKKLLKEISKLGITK
jgi:hypothetical protein